MTAVLCIGQSLCAMTIAPGQWCYVSIVVSGGIIVYDVNFWGLFLIVILRPVFGAGLGWWLWGLFIFVTDIWE